MLLIFFQGQSSLESMQLIKVQSCSAVKVQNKGENMVRFINIASLWPLSDFGLSG